MDSDWFVPGGAVIAEHATMRLRPPDHWRRDILLLNQVPPSMNNNQIRSGWRGFHREKKTWQEQIGLLLMQARTPRRNQRAIAGAIMRFAQRSRRDTGNFRGLVEKALGDALIISPQTPAELRYIPDDDAPHFFFGGVEFEEETGPPRTRIFLFTQPREG